MKFSITVIILTYNEELNIEQCLKSVADWASEIFIVDSHSTDGTAQIANRYGVKIVEHEFKNQAQQFNWALDNLDIQTEWILRLDADEYLTPELKEEISKTLTNLPRESALSPRESAALNGFYIKRRVYFMGRWIKHGGYYPTWILRLFRKGKARSEEREVDEHIVLLEGKSEKLQNDFIDENHKDLEWWIQRINNYTTREVTARSREKEGKAGMGGKLSGIQAERKRWLRKNIYYRLPLFVRAFTYFLYRYFIRLGFLDGKQGLVFHFLQGCWNQFLVDAKIYERKISLRREFQK